MMQHNKFEGARMNHRPVMSSELTMEQRCRIDGAYRRAEALRGAHQSLVAMASHDVKGFQEMARWVVATCRSGTEQAIAEELAEMRIDTWCPLEKFTKRPRRGLKPVNYYRPFFRGYLFCRIVPSHEAYAGLLAASRLNSIMGRDGSPFFLPERMMDALRLGTKQSKQDQDDERMSVWQGARVIVRSGPFVDFEATVRRVLKSRWKVVIEVALFGQMNAVEIDIDSVEVRA